MRWWELPGFQGDVDPDDRVPADDDQPSIMRLLLEPEDVERLEITPGQWYFPGPPP